MNDWNEVTLGEVLTGTSRPVVVSSVEKVPFAGARWYAEGIYARTVEEATKVKTKILHRLALDDITYNRMWATKAAFGVVDSDAGGCLVTNDFPIFVADQTRLIPAYMRLIFQTTTFQTEAAVRAVGTTERRRLKEPDFLSIKVLLPSVVEQRRIVDGLSAVDAQIEALAAEIAALQGATDAMRANLLEPKDHWERVSVGEVATPVTGRAFPDRFQGNRNGVLPYFKVSDMSAPGNERELANATNWLTVESREELKPRVCPAGTVVFPIIGAALLTEKRRIITQPSAFDQNLMGLIIGERITSAYMLAVMSNMRLSELTQRGAVPSVNQRLVSSIEIGLPPIEEQIEIGDSLITLYHESEALAAELSAMRSFRSAFLTALLNREIEIPESYDRLMEPTTVGVD